MVDFDAVAIYLVNRHTLALELVHEIGYPEGSEEAFEVQVGQGIVGWVAKTGEPVIVPDVAQDSRYVEARTDTRSELAAPLTVEGRTIGVFNLESDLEDAYHEGHLEILRGFAAQAAVAVERAQLTRELLDQRRLEKELAIARDIQPRSCPSSRPRSRASRSRAPRARTPRSAATITTSSASRTRASGSQSPTSRARASPRR